ncbi:Uncharacterized protein DAT39_018924 [Clarias magur]|uniref:Uncharacterized protein n=1 Tax=Clarias magur TaxID=1594786 RepID=A0A8J4WSE4_CLAMG|nr:Uncharacterized protein DAT39_018924 [Clarias magur]
MRCALALVQDVSLCTRARPFKNTLRQKVIKSSAGSEALWLGRLKSRKVLFSSEH